jgi:hypothetical protein
MHACIASIGTAYHETNVNCWCGYLGSSAAVLRVTYLSCKRLCKSASAICESLTTGAQASDHPYRELEAVLTLIAKSQPSDAKDIRSAPRNRQTEGLTLNGYYASSRIALQFIMSSKSLDVQSAEAHQASVHAVQACPSISVPDLKENQGDPPLDHTIDLIGLPTRLPTFHQRSLPEPSRITHRTSATTTSVSTPFLSALNVGSSSQGISLSLGWLAGSFTATSKCSHV